MAKRRQRHLQLEAVAERTRTVQQQSGSGGHLVSVQVERKQHIGGGCIIRIEGGGRRMLRQVSESGVGGKQS